MAKKIKVLDAGNNKLNVIRDLKDLTGMGLKECKDIVDTCDEFEIPEGRTIDDCVAAMQLAGATVEIVE